MVCGTRGLGELPRNIGAAVRPLLNIKRGKRLNVLKIHTKDFVINLKNGCTNQLALEVDRKAYMCADR